VSISEYSWLVLGSRLDLEGCSKVMSSQVRLRIGLAIEYGRFIETLSVPEGHFTSPAPRQGSLRLPRLQAQSNMEADAVDRHRATIVIVGRISIALQVEADEKTR
jgi:hypothetical protein